MKIKPYVAKLNNSKTYKQFQKKYEDAFMIAGFFILDLEMGKNLHQIDYYVPTEKKIAAFTLDGGVTMQMLDMMNNKLVPEKLEITTKVDLDALKGILEDEMKNRNITDDIKKIIAIIQTIDGKKIWNLNCVLSGMSILKAHIDDESETVLKMEKASIMDLLKKIPGGALPGMGGAKGIKMDVPKSVGAEAEEAEESEDAELPAGSEAELKEKISTLNKLEKEIESEKNKISKELAANPAKEKKAKSKTEKAESKEDKKA